MPYKDPEVKRVKGLEYMKQWRERNPGWQKHTPSYGIRYSRPSKPAWDGHNAVARAIQKGTLVRPGNCERCGKECKPEAAHRDYAQPLLVDWLCVRCHRQEDSDRPKGGVTTLAEPYRSSEPMLSGWMGDEASGGTGPNSEVVVQGGESLRCPFCGSTMLNGICPRCDR